MDLDVRVRQLVAEGQGEAASVAAIEALGPAILGYLRALHRADDAEDVFQTWAEDIWHGISAFRGECHLRTWAFRLAWHASSRFCREPWFRRRERLATSAASRLAASVAQSALLGRRDERLEALRSQLDPADRTLLLLRLDRELSWEDIATVLASEGDAATPAALRKRFQRLKDRLGDLARAQGLLTRDPK